MKIVFDPKASKTNKYVEIIGRLLEEKGIKLYSLSGFFSAPFSLHTLKVVHLNWYENLVGNSTPRMLLSFATKSAKLLFLKALGKKIVWTMHNKLPHDQRALFLKRAMMFLIFQVSDLIVIHSEVSRNILVQYNRSLSKKIIYIPHPNYIGEYGDRPFAKRTLSHKQEPLKLLFLGAVRAYKNIELLIDVVKGLSTEVMLTVAGKPENEAYKNKLINYCQGATNVQLDLKFVPDEEVPTYIKASDLLVLPYDQQSSLNSGAAILAFSYGKTVICPKIGTISDLERRDSVLSYTYSNERQHSQMLLETVSKAIDLKKKEEGIFESWGENMYHYVSEKHNNEKIIATLISEYSKLVGRVQVLQDDFHLQGQSKT